MGQRKEISLPALLGISDRLLRRLEAVLLVLLEERPRHINALSSALGMERRLVSYHLLTLEDKGFVTSKYEISEEPRSKGKALRVYKVSAKVADVKAKLKKAFSGVAVPADASRRKAAMKVTSHLTTVSK